MPSIWDRKPELVRELIHLWNDNKSASQAAVILGNGLTRNACLAKLDRLRTAGVLLRAAQPRVKRARIPRPPKPPKPIYVPPGELAPLELDGVPYTAENSKDSNCRWPYGDPASSEFRYCGRQTVKGSFCFDHTVSAHQQKHASTAAQEDAA